MNTKTSLLEEIVEFCMGRWTKESNTTEFSEVYNFIKNDKLTAAVIAYNAGQRRILPLNGYHERLVREDDFWAVKELKWGSDNRVANFCSYLDSMNMSGNFVMSLTDAAYWSFNERKGALGYPIIQFARHRGDSGAVLFPLDYKYMGIGSVNLPTSVDDIDMPYNQKKDAAVWRGRLSGTIRRNGGTSYAEKIIPSLLKAKTEEEFREVMKNNMHYSRILLCHLYGKNLEIDVGITGPGDFYYDENLACMQWPYAQRFLAPRKSIRDQLGYRYIICIAGNDFPSGLYWALCSNSIVLMPEPTWQTPLDFGLQSWKHFIPIAEDFSDLLSKIYWCRSNRAEVLEVNERAKAFCKTLHDPALRDAADQAVVSRYEGLARRTPKPKPISFALDKYLSEVRMYSQGGAT